MFSLKREPLMLNLRPPESVALIPPITARRAWDSINVDMRRAITARADNALANNPPPLTASTYLSGAPSAEAIYATLARLDALASGALATTDRKYTMPLVDALWALLECTSWSLPDPDNPGLPDQDAPKIDPCAARIAASVALTVHALGPALQAVSSEILRRATRELSIRIFQPLSTERALTGPANIPICESLIMASLLMDFDRDRRWLCLRHLLGRVERAVNDCLPDGGMTFGLERHMRGVFALSNILTMLSAASGGAFEARDDETFVRMAQLPALLHIAGKWFLNPGGDSPMPALCPDQLFLLGDSVRSGELCELAAYLARESGDGAKYDLSLLDTLQAALYRNLFLRESARASSRPGVRLPAMQLLAARMGRFYAALSGGVNEGETAHLDVGDFTLFYNGRPIIIDPGHGPASALHSVPEIGMAGQSEAGLRPQSGVDSRFDPELTMLSIGIGHAYPKSCAVLNWQRSVMLSAFEGNVRLMDVVDFDRGEKRGLAFDFMAATSPKITQGGILIGPIRMGWEGELQPQIERMTLPDGPSRDAIGPVVYRIRFETQGPVPSGKYAFLFQPVED